MPVWTLVIGDRPIYAFAANDQITAELRLKDERLKNDLSYYEDHTGKPLWDGETPFVLRLATPAEYRTWEQVQERRSGDDVTRQQDTRHFASFLVRIHDPADDEVLLM